MADLLAPEQTAGLTPPRLATVVLLAILAHPPLRRGLALTMPQPLASYLATFVVAFVAASFLLHRLQRPPRSAVWQGAVFALAVVGADAVFDALGW